MFTKTLSILCPLRRGRFRLRLFVCLQPRHYVLGKQLEIAHGVFVGEEAGVPVYTENLNPEILVMKSAKDWA